MDRKAAEVFLDHFGLSPAGSGIATLEEVARAFSSIPWENLTKYLSLAQDPQGRERPRMPLQLFEEHVSLGTGGTCFSLTRALESVLRRLEYSCRPLMADMSHGPDIHCGLLVAVDGKAVLCDPGYLVPVPVVLSRSAAVEVEAAGQTFRYVPERGGWNMFTVRDGRMRWRYRLKAEHVEPGRFDEHWRRSFHATGMNGLHLNRLTDSGRLYAHNGNLRVVENGSRRNEKMSDHYAEAVEEGFGLDREIAGRAWKRLQLARRARR